MGVGVGVGAGVGVGVVGCARVRGPPTTLDYLLPSGSRPPPPRTPCYLPPATYHPLPAASRRPTATTYLLEARAAEAHARLEELGADARVDADGVRDLVHVGAGDLVRGQARLEGGSGAGELGAG